MRITNNFKKKITTTLSGTLHFDKGQRSDNNNNNNSGTIIEKYSCWSILFIDRLKIEAKIVHKGRGKFMIVEDKYKGRYVNQIVDASDVIYCKVGPDNNTPNIMSKDKLPRFSNQKQYINLETYKKTGEAVRTPMWFVNYNGTIYVSTSRDSWKVKRLNNNSHVRIVPCNFTGYPDGEWTEAEAHVVNSNESEKANKLLKQKYDLQATFPSIVEELVISICI
jgi:PPOX class probable F420-dependent enzyme